MESSDDWSSRGDEDEAAAAAAGDRESIGIKAWEGDKSESSEPEEEDEEDDDEDSWDDELQSFLEESPEYRAKVQYQVRVVALIPGFEALGSKVSAFPHFYKLRFGKTLLENTGFSSAEILCRSMPHVIQRQALDKQGEVLLVESYKNMRSVAGIRSGLRRVVFQILKQHPKGISAAALDKECSTLIGRPLSTVLTELAYDTSNVECMVRDMADIASYRGISGVFLSSEAEDPALTDGILLQRSGLCASEDGQTTVTISGNDVMQARLRTAVLLALHSDGIEVSRLQKSYAEAYTENLDCRLLGFTSVAELVSGWDDIMLLQDSSAPQRVFLRPTVRTCRLLRTLSSGLRLAVFSILLKCYPDGLEPALVLSQLPEPQLERIVAMYSGSGSKHDKEDLTLHAFCLMVQDMEDFVDFGCVVEDGMLILKLRDAGFPLVDFPDCGSSDEFVELLVEGGNGNAMVGSSEDGDSFFKLVEREDDENPAAKHNNKAKVEQQIRLIMSSFSDGLPPEDFLAVYKERTGESLTAAQLRELVSRTPGLVRMAMGRIRLVQSPKNVRIVRSTMAGLRQLLYWALVSNPGGLWSELLEGWFTDFTGYSLAGLLLKFGYSGSSPVDDFLQDMSDVCSTNEESEGLQCYFLCLTEDPTASDSALSGAEVEYEPVKLCLEIEGGSGARSGEDDGEEQEDGNGNEYQPPKAYVDETD